MELNEIRENIDKVDKELTELFKERMDLVTKVLEYKKENNLPVKNEKRESEIIKKRTESIENYKGECAEFFKLLMDISCKYQERNLNGKKIDTDFIKISKEEFIKNTEKVFFQGIKGSYGYEASCKIFNNSNIEEQKTFSDVCKKVCENENYVGVLPLENLSAGTIDEVYNLIEKYKLNIILTYDLPISHCLLGKGKLEDIKKVKSHPQALCQCDEFIEEKGYEKINSVNTATAAREIAEGNNKEICAIGSIVNKDLYGLNVLKENIANIDLNKTKFAVISKKKYIIDPKEISMVFSLPHRAGSLAEILNDFALNGLNLTKIKSAPIESNEWEYLFYVNIEGSLFDLKTKKHIEDMGFLFDYVRIIGNYN